MTRRAALLFLAVLLMGLALLQPGLRTAAGEYQVNYGPDEDNKVFSFRWKGLPAAAYPKVGVYVSP